MKFEQGDTVMWLELNSERQLEITMRDLSGTRFEVALGEEQTLKVAYGLFFQLGMMRLGDFPL